MQEKSIYVNYDNLEDIVIILVTFIDNCYGYNF